MKKLNITWEGIYDSTGYMFSFAKCLACSIKNSPYAEFSEDIVASSGFAFRMWIDGKEFCPSATSIWEFKNQEIGVHNAGLTCNYVERLWEENEAEEERRNQAITNIKQSIDHGIAAIAWDISGCEWGLIIGYDEEQKRLYTLKVQGDEAYIGYEELGKLEIPILSVLTITGVGSKAKDQVIRDTKGLAVAHLNGEEWCDNAQGLAAYPAMINFITDKLSSDSAWHLEYYLGTYAPLKYYAWKYFEKFKEEKLGRLYEDIYKAWQEAFDITKKCDITLPEHKDTLIGLLKKASILEGEACMLMEGDLKEVLPN